MERMTLRCDQAGRARRLALRQPTTRFFGSTAPPRVNVIRAVPNPPESPPAGRTARVSLRTIAEAAGVSAMTVSKALRNVPKVAPRTRLRILRIAARIGYTPDPELAKLMVHLRRQSHSAYQGLLGAVTNRPLQESHRYVTDLVVTAEEQAKSRGYGFEVFEFGPTPEQRRKLRRILWARGVQGVLLLPLRAPMDLGDLLAWPDLCVVAATATVLGPEVHRVIPDHFENTARICRQLTEQGYQRIGLVIDADQEMRVNRAFSAAVVRHNLRGRRVLVPPFIYGALEPAALRTWFRREAPDAIIATDETLCRRYAELLGLRVPGPVAFASTNTSAESAISGIDERPDTVASTAVDLLVSLIQHGNRGLPPHPTTTRVQGVWHEGKSVETLKTEKLRR